MEQFPLALALASCLLFGACVSKDHGTGVDSRERASQRQLRKSFQSLDGRQTVWYWEYLPEAYASGTERYPLLVFFHGRGASGRPDGSQLDRVKEHGPPMLISADHDMCFATPAGRQCFIVVSPQNARDWWSEADTAGMLVHALATYRVDPKRIYVTGLSMGGGAAWDLVTAKQPGVTPTRYWASDIAAVVPIAGASWSKYRHDGLCKGIVATHLAVWAFHGDADTTVAPEASRTWVDKINGARNDDGYACASQGDPPARLTMYRGVRHDSWTATYDPANEVEPGVNLYQWLLAQHR